MALPSYCLCYWLQSVSVYIINTSFWLVYGDVRGPRTSTLEGPHVSLLLPCVPPTFKFVPAPLAACNCSNRKQTFRLHRETDSVRCAWKICALFCLDDLPSPTAYTSEQIDTACRSFTGSESHRTNIKPLLCRIYQIGQTRLRAIPSILVLYFFSLALDRPVYIQMRAAEYLTDKLSTLIDRLSTSPHARFFFVWLFRLGSWKRSFEIFRRVIYLCSIYSFLMNTDCGQNVDTSK